jgi:hypothetical protein
VDNFGNNFCSHFVDMIQYCYLNILPFMSVVLEFLFLMSEGLIFATCFVNILLY